MHSSILPSAVEWVYRQWSKYNIEIYAEPGEAIVGDAGKFYTTVVEVRKEGNITDVYIDSGIPHGVAARHQPTNINILGRGCKSDTNIIYRFIDCTCMGSALIIKRLKANICVGDVLEFEGCGAYTTVFCNDFHAYEKCKVIMK